MCYSNILTLTGLPASGKTSIGKLLAKHLQYNFIDLDNYITKKYNLTISDIFNTLGETKFREFETTALKKIINTPIQNLVLSLGGGTICFNNNLSFCLKNSLVIWLNTHLSIIKKRLLNKSLQLSSHRPIFYNTDVSLKLNNLYKERLPFYSQSHIKVDIKKENINKTVLQIKNFILSYGK